MSRILLPSMAVGTSIVLDQQQCAQDPTPVFFFISYILISNSYAFDVSCIHNEAFLVNKRLFAVADTTIPDGIKCDLKGNVYSGICGGDGVAVWSPGGVLIGKIVVPGGAANFCFGRDGEMFILNENKVWRAKLGSGTKGALLGI